MICTKTSDNIPIPKLRGIVENIIYPAIADIKYDGELAQITVKDGKWSTTNKFGLTRHDWKKDKFPDIGYNGVFLGELFWENGFTGDLYELLKNKDVEDKLHIKIFDVLAVNNAPITNVLITRKEILATIFAEHQFMISGGACIEHLEDVKEYMERVVSMGYEGIVIKNMNDTLTIPNTGWAKLKHKDRNDFPVTLIDPTKERVEFTNSYCNKLGETLTKTVGVKVMNKDKNNLKTGDIITIEHQGILKTGGLRHPVFIKKVGA